MLMQCWTQESVESKQPHYEIPYPYETGVRGYPAWKSAATAGAPGEVGPDGNGSRAQVDPPSVVETTAPARTPFSPTAAHVDADGHEMPVRSKVPAGRVSSPQVVPPSVVAMMSPRDSAAPATAQQVVAVGHEMAPTSWVPAGGIWSLQLAPPSVVARRTPVEISSSFPVAQQFVTVGQAMSRSE